MFGSINKILSATFCAIKISSLITAEMISSRAQSRGQDVEQYMSSNLLGQEVAAEHVAKAFVDLALSPRTTGAVLTVDGGNIAAALR